MLLFAATEIEDLSMELGVNNAAAGLLGGMGGGIAQAYATMGECLLCEIQPIAFRAFSRILYLYENCRDHET